MEIEPQSNTTDAGNGSSAGRISVPGDPTVSEPRPAELSAPATARLVNSPGTERDPALTRKAAAVWETLPAEVQREAAVRLARLLARLVEAERDE